MAKKVVATLKKETSISVTKVIKAFKKEKNGCLSFKEVIIPSDQVQDYLNGKTKF